MRTHTHAMMLIGIAIVATLMVSACSTAVATPTLAPTPVGSGNDITPGTSNPVGAVTLALDSMNSPTLGAYLTAQNSMTLYVNSNDTANTSTCTGACTTTWTPLSVATGTDVAGPLSATGTFGTFARPDGMTQVTYNQMPLYYYSGDSVAGDTTGQGVDGIWSVAALSGPSASSIPTVISQTSSPSVIPSVSASSSGGY